MSDRPFDPDGLLVPVPFSALAGWDGSDPATALAAFSLGVLPDRRARPPAPRLVAAGAALDRLAADARLLIAAGPVPAPVARTFFERFFRAFRIGAAGGGFLTGYFEPELPASLVATERFSVPLLALPPGLEPVAPEALPPGFPAGVTVGRRTGDGLVPLPDRAAIDAGALGELAPPLVYLENPVDAFFVHVQGAARLRLADGTVLRVGYAGRNGWPYTAIGRVLVQRGVARPEELTADRLRARLLADPAAGQALMHENRSFIFFRRVDEVPADAGPPGTAGVPLTAGISLAVDPAFVPLGSPLVFSAALPDPDGGTATPTVRLGVAQDTGSAIKGAARADLFVGSGAEAGMIAGRMRQPATFTLLVPRTLLPEGADD